MRLLADGAAIGRVTDLLTRIIKSATNEADWNEASLRAQMEAGLIEARDKGQFLTLEMNGIFANLRKVELALNLEFKVEILNASQQITQLQRNSFQWFHEDSLPTQLVTPVQPLRSQVLADLNKGIVNLVVSQKELIEIHSRYQELNG